MLRLRCGDAALLATVDVYARPGCAMELEPVYAIVREDGRDQVRRAWRVTVYPPTSEPRLPEPKPAA